MRGCELWKGCLKVIMKKLRVFICGFDMRSSNLSKVVNGATDGAHRARTHAHSCSTKGRRCLEVVPVDTGSCTCWDIRGASIKRKRRFVSSLHWQSTAFPNAATHQYSSSITKQILPPVPFSNHVWHLPKPASSRTRTSSPS